MHEGSVKSHECGVKPFMQDPHMGPPQAGDSSVSHAKGQRHIPLGVGAFSGMCVPLMWGVPVEELGRGHPCPADLGDIAVGW